MCQMQYTITQFGLIPRSWEARTAGEGMPISSSIMGLAADVRTREGLGHRDGAEHDKGPERLSKTPALFPLPQKRCGYYSVIEPGQSEESGPPTVGVVGAPTYERSRCAKHGEYDSAFRGVPAPPGMGIF